MHKECTRTGLERCILGDRKILRLQRKERLTVKLGPVINRLQVLLGHFTLHLLCLEPGLDTERTNISDCMGLSKFTRLAIFTKNCWELYIAGHQANTRAVHYCTFYQ